VAKGTDIFHGGSAGSGLVSREPKYRTRTLKDKAACTSYRAQIQSRPVAHAKHKKERKEQGYKGGDTHSVQQPRRRGHLHPTSPSRKQDMDPRRHSSTHQTRGTRAPAGTGLAQGG